MKPVERIPIFLGFIKGNLQILVDDIWKLTDELDYDSFVDAFYDEETEIEKFWYKFPDLRFSQVLINMGIIPNIPGSWYYIEEKEILEKLGIPSREYLLWGQNYDKNMKLLPNTIYKPIKDLTTEHIKAILDGNFCKSEEYKKCFEEELKLREDGNT